MKRTLRLLRRAIREPERRHNRARRKNCDHGVFFDADMARRYLAEARHRPSMEPAVAFIMGNPASALIRKCWPRLSGKCPKGCGYYGIYYASYEHYIAGDW